MCLLFVYANPSAKEGEYKLILVNNRDEYYARPTKVAHFWDSKILGGMDAEKGKEGGTWLGVEEKGRIACLLNIFQPKAHFLKNGVGRGFLAVDYLLEKETGVEYLDKLSKNGLTYNPFNLVLIEPSNTSYDVIFYNSDQKECQVLEPGFHAFGNSSYDKPFKKVVKGKRNFQKIVEMHGKMEVEEQLISELDSMMKDSEKNTPDSQLAEQGQGHPEALLTALSSLFVMCDLVGYGTRTTTIILVDHSDRVVFRERTMKEPIDLQNVEWQVSEYSFKRKMVD